MPKSNRADYTAYLEAIGIDPSSSGLPLADGLQAVLSDLPIFAPRKTFAVTGVLVAGVAGRNNFLSLVTRVPTRIHYLAFDSTTNGTQGNVFVGAAGLIGATVLTPQNGYPGLPPRNTLFEDNTAAPVTTAMKIAEGSGLGDWRKIFGDEGWAVDANVSVQLFDPTVAASTFWSIVWSEQVSPAV